MYSGLRKIDIAGEQNGRKVYIQTDHRDLDEVAAEEEISVLFALTRMLGARRVALENQKGGADFTLQYICMYEMHPAIARVLVATGAEGQVNDDPVSLVGIEKRAPADLADEAFASLAKKVLAREELEATEAGLTEFAQRMGAKSFDPEEDEIAYWTAVVELAAVTGETLRKVHGGRWVDDPKAFSDIPFMFGVEGTLSNVAGKVVRFLEHGEGQSPVQLLRAMEDRALDDGPILLTLKPSHWAGAAQSVSDPLASLGPSFADMPLVAYGRDKPNTFAIFLKNGEHEKDMPGLRKEALANLAKVEVEVERHETLGFPFLVVTGSYFACEKILDVAFMKELQRRLEAKLLLAAVPAKGQLLVLDGISGTEPQSKFIGLVQHIFDENKGDLGEISPTTFIVADGVIAGLAMIKTDGTPDPTSGGTPEPPPEKKGFFKRLFG